MALPLNILRARLLDIRARILAHGGGALHIFGGIYPGVGLSSASAPLVIRGLTEEDLVVHETAASLTINAEANAALTGTPTWARFVDGEGATVYDCSAGLPGSGAQLIVSDGQDPPAANIFPGGVLTLAIELVEV